MKTAILLFLVLVMEIASAQTVTRKRILLPSGTPAGDGPTVLMPGPSDLKLAGHTLSFPRTKDGTSITDEAGKVIYTTTGGRQVHETLVSASGAWALLGVWRYEGAGGWYDHLLRLHVTPSGLVFEKLWPDGEELLPGRRWWMSELGALSDDGKTALLKMADTPIGNGTVAYGWQTWELTPAKRIGIGLTISNGARDR